MSDPALASRPPSQIIADDKAEFFKGPDDDRKGELLDFSPLSRSFLDALSEQGELRNPLGSRILLPANYEWIDPQSKRRRIPVPLCEFLAYKSALVYEQTSTIAANIGPAQNFTFFCSRSLDVADTQGCGFVDDGLLYIIMRGTEQNLRDAAVDFYPKFTDDLTLRQKEILADKQFQRMGPEVKSILQGLEKSPGRHLGFSIGWAAIREQVLKFLDDKSNGFAVDIPIVLSGHSLGGSLALLCASDLKKLGRNVEAVVTFGAPPAGNETFQKEYKDLGLDDRTICFEAEFDSIPRIMRRAYFRAGQQAKQLVKERIFGSAHSDTSLAFAGAGGQFKFSGEPVLSESELEATIRAIVEQAREREKREAEQKKKQAEQQSRPTGSQPQSPIEPTPSTSTQPEPVSQDAHKGWSFSALAIGFVLVLFSIFAAIFLRAKLAAHSVLDRYALFLSTLSYQKIRSFHAHEDGSPVQRLNRANRDLDRYLRFIRRDGSTGAPYYSDVSVSKPPLCKLPVRLTTDINLNTFLSENSGKRIV